MLTPQEVSDRAFQKASFGGYNMGQVDEFLDVLTADYSALYNENTVLKGKMKVLVDKVEEYRATEEAMRKALMTAQRMADDLVKEAEEKKAEILRQAELDLKDRMGGLSTELEAEQFRLEKAQQATAAFVAKVRTLHAQEEELLSRLSELCPQAHPADPVDETVSQIDDSVQRLLAQAMQDASAGLREEEPSPQPEPPEETELSGDTAEFAPVTDEEVKEADREPSPGGRPGHIDFGSLQFGRDYEIK